MTGWLRNAFGADKAQDASRLAAAKEEEQQQAALNYLKEREALPIQLRDQALQGLGGIYLDGDQPLSQQSLIDKAMGSPLYQALMGTKDRALQAITSRAGATGNLRSGSHQVALGREAQRIDQEALLTSYLDQLRGVQGLAGLQGNEDAVARTMTGIGNTRAQGIVDTAQAGMTAQNNAFNSILGLGSLAVGAGLFSDIRLKKNIRQIGQQHGYRWYLWEWNETARALGLQGYSEGVLAHEVVELNPDAIGLRDGYLTVDYSALKRAA